MNQGPGPLTRRGPRPLLMHLALATMRQGESGTKAGWLPLELAEQMSRLSAAAADPSVFLSGDGLFGNGPEGEAIAALVAGIAAYRRHPWRRELPEPPVAWQEGGSRLLDYRPPRDRQHGLPGVPALLLVPSLVNRAHVLDLAEGRSMTRFLAAAGVRVMLLDWGWPGPLERGFGLDDYIAGRLARAVEAAAALAGGRVVLGGYCMGGLLAVATALRQPSHVRGLALLATPWDFHAAGVEQARALANLAPMLEPAMRVTASLSVDLLQMLFAMLEPDGIAEKYRGFGRLDQGSERARMFVALEDWLNDGVPLAAPVARECLTGWYGANTPGRGEWHVAGKAVDPGRLAMPVLAAIPGRDRIVPPESARPLAAMIPDARVIEPKAGHIGMAAGSNAEAELWRPLHEWLRTLAG